MWERALWHSGSPQVSCYSRWLPSRRESRETSSTRSPYFHLFFPDLNQYSFESKAEPSCSSECKQVQLSADALPIHGRLPWAIGPISEDIYTLSDNITGAATPPVCRCFKFKLICKRSQDFGTGWTNFG